MLEVDGILQVPLTTSKDDVVDLFIDFVESQGWFFGGGLKELSETQEVEEAFHKKSDLMD